MLIIQNISRVGGFVETSYSNMSILGFGKSRKKNTEIVKGYWQINR